VKHFSTRDAAYDYASTFNHARRAAGNGELLVVVDGPDDGAGTVMELAEAIDNGFTYSWEA
jgi:hypothetical protein